MSAVLGVTAMWIMLMAVALSWSSTTSLLVKFFGSRGDYPSSMMRQSSVEALRT
jgi:hypothetical protein